MAEPLLTVSSFKEKYKYERQLGSGGVGRVDLYIEKSTEKQVAVKEVRIEQIVDKKYANRPIEVLKKLQHPYILEYYGYFTTEEETYYLLFEYLPGGDLFHYLQQPQDKQVSLQRVSKWMRQVTMALQYLHSHDIIHRDVKPANVLLTSLNWDQADAKLADFDLVRDTRTDMTRGLGTTVYSAPETKKNRYDQKADVWSLGCMTFQLLTGKCPFQEYNKEALTRGPDYPSDMDGSAREFIETCLRFDPDRRLTCKQLLDSPFLSAWPFSIASSLFQGFKYKKSLGSGSVGHVDLYVHEATNKRMAVKVVNNDSVHEKYMARSIEALETFRHPHMLTYYGHLKTENEYYLLFEYLPGQDLLRHAKQQAGKPVSRMRVMKWIKQVTLALQYLHSNGMMHRDVKPANVLLTSLDWDEADAKLADFDTVRNVEGLMSMSLGSLPYMSPESYHRVYDAKVDVWGLGCMTYQLLTCHLPFQVYEPEIFRLGPAYPPDLDSVAKEFIQQCLVFYPGDRATCEQLLQSRFLSTPPMDYAALYQPRVNFLSGSLPAKTQEQMFVESFNSVLCEGLEQARLLALWSPTHGKACADTALRHARMSLDLFKSYTLQNPGFRETLTQLTEKTRILQDFSEQCGKRMS